MNAGNRLKAIADNQGDDGGGFFIDDQDQGDCGFFIDDQYQGNEDTTLQSEWNNFLQGLPRARELPNLQPPRYLWSVVES